MEGTVIVISGPAGVGKTTLCEKLLSEFPNSITQVITATTRHPGKVKQMEKTTCS